MSHQCTYLPAAEQCHGISPLQKKTVRRACWAILCRLWEASDLNGIEKGVLLLCGFISSIKLRSVFKFGFLSHPSPLERARPLSEMCQAAGAGLSPCSFQAEGLSFCFSCYCLDGGALVIVSDVSECFSDTSHRSWMLSSLWWPERLTFCKPHWFISNSDWTFI